MAKCVMCEKDVIGFYDYDGAKIPVCFEHYEDGTFANYLAAQHSAHSDAGKPADLQADSNADNLSTSQGVA